MRDCAWSTRSAGAVATAVALCGAAALLPHARADTISESFENGFGAFSENVYLDCLPDCPFSYSVERTTARAFDGAWSVEITAEGSYDDGTVWIQRPIALDAGTWDVTLAFEFFSETASPINAWQIIAYIGPEPPDHELDFTVLGPTATEGWDHFELAETIEAGAPMTMYIAVGVNIVWESMRTYWIDSVSISGIPPQGQCPADVTGDDAVDIDDLVAVINHWGPCDDPADCPWDCEAEPDGVVGIDDLVAVINAWGPC